MSQLNVELDLSDVGAQVLLSGGLSEMGVVLDSEQQSQCLRFLSLMQKWNKTYNLTAIRDPKDMVVKHLLDSLSVVPRLRGERILDVGAGGGLPGIPLAIAYPDKRFTLLDSNTKKTRFLRQVAHDCGLDNVGVECCRVENYSVSALFDSIICRAFSSVSDFVIMTEHLGVAGCEWVAMKALCSEGEIEALPEDFYVEESVGLNVAGLNAQRSLIKIKKRS